MPQSPTNGHCPDGIRLVREYQQPAISADDRVLMFDRFIEHLVGCAACLGAEQRLTDAAIRPRS